MSEVIFPGLKPIPKEPLFKFKEGDRVRIITPAINDEGKQNIYQNPGLFDFIREMEKSIGKITTIKRAWDARTDYDLDIKYYTYKLEDFHYSYRSFFLIPEYLDDQEAIQLLKEKFEQQVKQ